MLISYYANKKSSPRLPSWQPSLISFNIPIDSGSIIKPCTLKHFQVPILAPGLNCWVSSATHSWWWKTGDLCLIINLSQLKDHLIVPWFKIETKASVCSAIRENKWIVFIDIQDSYLYFLMAWATWENARTWEVHGELLSEPVDMSHIEYGYFP